MSTETALQIVKRMQATIQRLPRPVPWPAATQALEGILTDLELLEICLNADGRRAPQPHTAATHSTGDGIPTLGSFLELYAGRGDSPDGSPGTPDTRRISARAVIEDILGPAITGEGFGLL